MLYILCKNKNEKIKKKVYNNRYEYLSVSEETIKQ